MEHCKTEQKEKRSMA